MESITIKIHFAGGKPNKLITEDHWYIDNTDIYDSIFSAMGWKMPISAVIPPSHRGSSNPGTFGSTVDAYHKAIKTQAPDVLKIDYFLNGDQSERTIIYVSSGLA